MDSVVLFDKNQQTEPSRQQHFCNRVMPLRHLPFQQVRHCRRRHRRRHHVFTTFWMTLPEGLVTWSV